jgi:hypothetical protein
MRIGEAWTENVSVGSKFCVSTRIQTGRLVFAPTRTVASHVPGHSRQAVSSLAVSSTEIVTSPGAEKVS